MDAVMYEITNSFSGNFFFYFLLFRSNAAEVVPRAQKKKRNMKCQRWCFIFPHFCFVSSLSRWNLPIKASQLAKRYRHADKDRNLKARLATSKATQEFDIHWKFLVHFFSPKMLLVKDGKMFLTPAKRPLIVQIREGKLVFNGFETAAQIWS